METFLRAKDEEGKFFTSGLCERDKEAQFRMRALVWVHAHMCVSVYVCVQRSNS